jgi:hypothetical protein
MCGEVACLTTQPPTMFKNQFQSIRAIPTLPNSIFLLRKHYNQKYKAEEPFPDHDLPLQSVSA